MNAPPVPDGVRFGRDLATMSAASRDRVPDTCRGARETPRSTLRDCTQARARCRTERIYRVSGRARPALYNGGPARRFRTVAPQQGCRRLAAHTD